MRIFRLRYALSLLAAGFALLAGGGLDWALEWTHDRLLALGEGDAAAAGGGPRPRPVDAVVVLGYVLARDGTPSAALEHRVRSAVREWERASRGSEEGEEREGGGGNRAKLVFSGGHPGSGLRGPRSEAAAMAGLASELLMLPSRPPPLLGGRKADWILEEASTSTWENAVESLELLSRAFVLSSSSSEGGGGGGEEVERKERGEEGLREKRRRVLSVSIATSPFHQRRALATFRCAAARRREREEEGGAAGKRGLRAAAPLAFSCSVAASPRPPPRGPPERFERAFEAAREVAAICWYRARGRLCGGG